jgi:hypothetical protein
MGPSDVYLLLERPREFAKPQSTNPQRVYIMIILLNGGTLTTEHELGVEEHRQGS